MRIAVVGVGAVGRAALETLVTDPAVRSVVAVSRRARPLGARGDVEVVAEASAGVPDDADAVIVTDSRELRRVAAAALLRGTHVVATADDPLAVRSLLGLHSEAQERRLTVAAGAGLAPGLGCVLARWAAARFDVVDEVHVASTGTAGPACARAHHASLSSMAVEYHDGAWRRRPGGSGRELVWFPEPVGGADCYRCDRADPILLVPAFPGIRRVTARVAATRRDRTTAWLPMMRPPHPEGLVGAVRSEVRGWRQGQAHTEVVGVSGRPGLVAGTVAAITASWAGAGRLTRPGAGGLGELVGEPAAFLRAVDATGIRTAMFEGSSASSGT
ncbi:MAG: hypothetical protein M3137_12255 [Actinomycetota bacterium]|nr:hypothetical protein [Actinomycetota bacterium]